MKKILTMAVVFCAILTLSGCGSASKSTSQTKPTSTKEKVQNFIKTEIIGENKMNPVVVIEMENGMIMNLELYPEKAPNTVNNFISLASKGYYDGLNFHRIIDGFMIQGGCPDGTGMGGPGYQIPGEFLSNGFAGNDIGHKAGIISMARARDKDSAGSQFFIMVGVSGHLDGDYAAFGSTIDEQSLQNCLELAKVPVMGDSPVDPPVIKSVKVDTKGVDYEEPNHS